LNVNSPATLSRGASKPLSKRVQESSYRDIFHKGEKVTMRFFEASEIYVEAA
jgi:hypothetical protein